MLPNDPPSRRWFPELHALPKAERDAAWRAIRAAVERDTLYVAGFLFASIAVAWLDVWMDLNLHFDGWATYAVPSLVSGAIALAGVLLQRRWMRVHLRRYLAKPRRVQDEPTARRQQRDRRKRRRR